jgi:hypothetical protein
MKILAWVLGTIAIVGSIVVGTNWARARAGGRNAATAYGKALEAVSEWQSGDAMHYRTDEMEVDNDELQLQNDDLDIRIAELRGIGLRKAQLQRQIDYQNLGSARLMVGLDQDQQAMGDSYHVVMAKEHADACRQSMQVYGYVLARDEKLAYALGAIWLAFGFAVALVKR